jgi:hypothetical protein
MNEQTKELAKQAGFHIASSNLGGIGWVWCSDGYPIDEQLDNLVTLVRQDEREACAKLCEEKALYFQYDFISPYDVADSCAEEIRKRGNA